MKRRALHPSYLCPSIRNCIILDLLHMTKKYRFKCSLFREPRTIISRKGDKGAFLEQSTACYGVMYGSRYTHLLLPPGRSPSFV